MKNIILVGFMGTGKTIVAKALAKNLNKIYVSIDEMIEKREGKAVTDIFKDDGEPYFRVIEKEIVREVTKKSNQIIDTGGGVVLNDENMENLKKNGIVICLWAAPKVILKRTRKYVHRPLLNVTNPKDKIKELLEYRRPFYEKADFHIDTAVFNIDEVVEKIKKIIKDKVEP